MNATNKSATGGKPTPKSPHSKMRSWRTDEDVERMILRVEKKGINLSWFYNEAVRKLAASKGYARKKDLAQ